MPPYPDAVACEIRQLCYKHFKDFKHRLLTKPEAHNLVALKKRSFQEWVDTVDELETNYNRALASHSDESLIDLAETLCPIRKRTINWVSEGISIAIINMAVDAS